MEERISTKGRVGVAGPWAHVHMLEQRNSAVRPSCRHLKEPCLTFDILQAFAKALKTRPMTQLNPFRVLTAALVLTLVAVVLPACNKQKPTKALITVQLEDGTKVGDALVQLYADPAYPLGDPSRLNKELTTDGGGLAVFDYSEFYKKGQSGFAVLDVLCTWDTLVGEGIIKIEEEQENSETITLLPAE